MSQRVFVLAILVVVAAASHTHLMACGDKFLEPGRGTRYERSTAARRGSAVLIYAPSASELSRTLARLAVDEKLRKAGYAPVTVATPSEFESAIRGRAWDLLVVDATDSQSASQRLPAARAPHLLPVLFNPTGDDLKAARKLNRSAVKAPGKAGDFVSVIDDGMDDAIEARAAQAKAAKKATH